MMTYDSVNNRAVLFGGSTLSNRMGDTWEWNGTSWTQRSTSGPAAREGASMAFDSNRGVSVLFGGQPINNS
jgi:hypothetical protein